VQRSRQISLAAGIAWTVLAGGLARHLSGSAVDDFFITYRYAWNLLHALGFVFNPGERVYGLTDPGFGLLLALVGWVIRIPIPDLGTGLTGFAMVGVALLLLREQECRETDSRIPEALVAGTLAIASSLLWVNQGAGVFWALFLLLGAARIGIRLPWLAGALAGLAVWMRPDAAIGVAALFVLLWMEERRLPWRFALVAALVVLAGGAATWSWFGAVLPNTLAAKQGLGEGSAFRTAGIGGFWRALEPILPRHWGHAWRWIALAGALGQIPLWRRSGRAGRTLIAYSLALALLYPLLGVPFCLWYLVPSVFAALYGLVFLAGDVGRWIAGRLRRAEREHSGPFAAALVFAFLVPFVSSLVPANLRWLDRHDWQPHLVVYRAAALWLRDHSEPGEDVAYVEIGVWGYYSQRTVVDLLGLVTPSSIPYARRGDRVGAFLAHPTRWVVYHSRGGMQPILDRKWFPVQYEEIARFDQGDGKELVLYRRSTQCTLPPPRAPRAERPRKAG
jgi:hypothetical protein